MYFSLDLDNYVLLFVGLSHKMPIILNIFDYNMTKSVKSQEIFKL